MKTIINLNIEHLTYIQTEYLKDFDCYGCRVAFNDKDLADNNFVLSVDCRSEIKKEGGTFIDQRQPFYNVILGLKGGEHKKCPAVARCDDCFTRRRTEGMRKAKEDDKWYCLETCGPDQSELRRNAVEKPVRRKRSHE